LGKDALKCSPELSCAFFSLLTGELLIAAKNGRAISVLSPLTILSSSVRIGLKCRHGLVNATLASQRADGDIAHSVYALLALADVEEKTCKEGNGKEIELHLEVSWLDEKTCFWLFLPS